MAIPQPELGHRIRAARERLDMTQEELGSAVRRSRSAVNAWENGRSVPMRSIGPLEDVLGVSLRGSEPGQPEPEPEPDTSGILLDDVLPRLPPDIREAMLGFAREAAREAKRRNAPNGDVS